MGLIVVVLIGTAMVGFGEELYFRGILRASIRAHHGELMTLLVTALVFGLDHSVGSAMTGEPLVFIALQVGGTLLDGVTFYGVPRATGRLWVGIVLHGLNDAVLYLASAHVTAHAATHFNPATWTGFAPIVLWILGLALVFSCILKTYGSVQLWRGSCPRRCRSRPARLSRLAAPTSARR